MTDISTKLKKKLKENNLVVSTLANDAGVPESSIKSIIYKKSKKPRTELVYALSQRLGCDVSDLLSDDDPRLAQKVDYHRLRNNSWNGELHLKAMHVVYKISSEEGIELTERKALELANKIYLYSEEIGDEEIDLRFAKWTIKNSDGTNN